MEVQDTISSRGISGSTLKIIAILTMLIDHTGAIILERFIIGDGMLYILDKVLRSVGRLAFPLFCFLLVEGFIYTGNRMKYAFRLIVFALISEVPFDLAVTGKVFSFSHQNVFFTLFLGFLTICILDEFKKKEVMVSSEILKKIISFVATAFIVAIGMFAAFFLKTDYSYAGVLTIVVMYGFRFNHEISMAGGCMVLTAYMFTEVFAFFDVFLVRLYNGKRGMNLKYVFYVIYPLHLLVFYFIAIWLGAIR